MKFSSGPLLTGVEMLIATKCGATYALSTFGATYSEPPTCKEAVKADIAWLMALDADLLARADQLNVDEFREAGPHIDAFLASTASAFFMEGAMPEVVEVPGLGRWTFEPTSKVDLG